MTPEFLQDGDLKEEKNHLPFNTYGRGEKHLVHLDPILSDQAIIAMSHSTNYNTSNTWKLSLEPCQAHSGYMHGIVVFLSSMVAALSLKHSSTNTSVLHRGQMNFVLQL